MKPKAMTSQAALRFALTDPSIEMRFIDSQPKVQFEQFDSDEREREQQLVCRLSTDRFFSRNCRTWQSSPNPGGEGGVLLYICIWVCGAL